MRKFSWNDVGDIQDVLIFYKSIYYALPSEILTWSQILEILKKNLIDTKSVEKKSYFIIKEYSIYKCFIKISNGAMLLGISLQTRR